ncbi:hypothetical protein Rhsp01_58680 [Rhizobium sp. NBRC 114257]|uniref:Core-binding (CB) domain-containing protein n=1 Tax=Rhizobium dioscoreae TaxID=2653122 RepID=A0ABQ0ZD81_9HYPH|nr:MULTISPECIES: hypothetical protein [Rhizobium]GES53252.1 hypothetical protein RsS93_58660 [Rhizobium dioscoreae]GLU84692.1 hypothetical protein Rhsp01_58680 [Rhizobium sp. NBRC 114257]
MIMNPTARSFQRKIAGFCEIRLAPLVSPAELERLTAYMLALVNDQVLPPVKGKTVDWTEIATACRLAAKPSTKLMRVGQHGFDAIIRWVNTNTATPRNRTSSSSASARISKARTAGSSHSAKKNSKPGAKPKPIEEFPVALFDKYTEPVSFQAALELHIRRFGETYYNLHRAVVRPDDTFDVKTLLSWLKGTKVPRSVESFDILDRIEHRYRLPRGYFKAKLPHQSRAGTGHDIDEEISPAERRRLAWHLPDNFNRLPRPKRREILEWVRRVIITGATDYRRFQAAAIKQRYAIRFPAMAYGGRASSVPIGRGSSNESNPVGDLDDPDLLSGVIDAPPRLALEMANLIAFKTSTLTAIGFQRNSVWGEETASQKLEHLGLMFGALAASPDGQVAGRGIPLGALTFGLLVFPGIWDWYLQWRERRRGFYTAWEADMLSIALSLTREETGWLRQHPELIERVIPIEGLVSAEEIAFAKRDWHACCDTFHAHARNRIKEIQRVMRIHRDPFEPIMCVLEAPSPLAEYRKITDEILLRMPDKDRYPRAAAESVRSFLMLRLGLHLGLRQKNLRQLLLCPRGHIPTSERRLEELKRGEIRWSDRDKGWEVLIPANAFKNSNSSFFGSKPFRLVLPDLLDLYYYINAYVHRHRRILLANANDPGTFFIKTVKQSSTEASYNQTTFYEAWRLTVQRYGIYNPYTGRGAIKGLLPHGPHNVRDVLATHILKLTGSYEQASYAIQDTPDMIQQHYGCFLPQDKAALAAKILNQVWEAA